MFGDLPDGFNTPLKEFAGLRVKILINLAGAVSGLWSEERFDFRRAICSRGNASAGCQQQSDNFRIISLFAVPAIL